MFEYHIHSSFSVDSQAVMTEVCNQAVDVGITEIAFTEHVDFIPEEVNTGYFDYEPYIAEIECCRKLFEGRLTILMAAEMDYCFDFESEMRDWLDSRELDFVVGSVHYLRGRGNISEPRAEDFFSGRSVTEVYTPYFEQVLCAAKSGLFDSLGHLDLIKRYGVKTYGPFDPIEFEDQIRVILQTIIDGGVCLELNTSGIRQGPKEMYPCESVVAMYREMGGELITTGSDSHRAKDAGNGLTEAYEMLERQGFDSVMSFRNRRGSAVALADVVNSPSVIH